MWLFVWWWWSGGVGRRRFGYDEHERWHGSDGSELIELSELTFEALGTIAEKKRHTPMWTDEKEENEENEENETRRKNDV